MKAGTKRILNYVFIFGMLAVVLFIGLRGNDLGASIQALRAVAPKWIALCALVYAGWMLSDALSIWYFLRRRGYRITVRYALYVSITGFYYSYITPGASGGQPMQVYSLKQRGVPVGIGTAAVTVRFFCFQLMLSVVCTVLWIAHGSFVAEAVGDQKWILVVGYVYNLVMVSGVLALAISVRPVRWLLRLIIRIGAKLRLIRNPEATQVKWEDVLSTFHDSVMMLRRRPMDLVVQLVLGAAQLVIQMLVIVCLYKGFGLEGVTASELVTLGVCLYISAAYTPLPGASGAQEGVFALYFGTVFPDGIRFMALLLWRFFTYYLALLVGAVVTVGSTMRRKKNSRT